MSPVDQRRLSWASRLTRAGVYLTVALTITWPLVLRPGSLVVGAPRTDIWNSLWGRWFTHHVGSVLPTMTSLLDFPTGGRIVVADPLNALLSWPLTGPLGPVATQAVLVIAHITFAGLAADALGRANGGRGWLAGIAYQLAPIAIANLHNGSSEAISTGWLPLAAWALLLAVRRGGAWRSLGAGLALAACALGGWYAGVGAWIIVGAILLVGVDGAPARVRDRVLRLLPAMGLALLVTLPVARGTRAVAMSADGLVDIKQTDDLARIRRTLGAADPRVFFTPGPFRSPDFAHLEGNPGDFIHTAYLGWVLIALALLGSRRRDSAAWWITIAAGMVLAMGPVVVIDGKPLELFDRGVALPLPYLALESLPGFNSLSLLYRLAGVSALGLAVLADRLHPAWVGLVLAELLLVSPVRGLPSTTIPPSPGALRLIADSNQDGAVLNLPPAASRAYLYEQTLHGHPLVGSLNSGINRAGLELTRTARKIREDQAQPHELADVAREQGIRWVVMHRDVLMEDAWIEASGAFLRYGQVEAEDDRFRVIRLY